MSDTAKLHRAKETAKLTAEKLDLTARLYVKGGAPFADLEAAAKRHTNAKHQVGRLEKAAREGA